MKLIIGNVRAAVIQGNARVIVHINCYLEPGDVGYENYLHDELGAEGLPTGKKVLHTVAGKDHVYPPDVTEATIQADMVTKYRHIVAELPRAQAKATQLQHLAGLEYRED